MKVQLVGVAAHFEGHAVVGVLRELPLDLVTGHGAFVRSAALREAVTSHESQKENVRSAEGRRTHPALEVVPRSPVSLELPPGLRVQGEILEGRGHLRNSAKQTTSEICDSLGREKKHKKSPRVFTFCLPRPTDDGLTLPAAGGTAVGVRLSSFSLPSPVAFLNRDGRKGKTVAARAQST